MPQVLHGPDVHYHHRIYRHKLMKDIQSLTPAICLAQFCVVSNPRAALRLTYRLRHRSLDCVGVKLDILSTRATARVRMLMMLPVMDSALSLQEKRF